MTDGTRDQCQVRFYQSRDSSRRVRRSTRRIANCPRRRCRQVIAVDEQGRTVDYDYIMVICGLDLLEAGNAGRKSDCRHGLQ